MDLEGLLANPPELHVRGGKSFRWSIGAPPLRLLDRRLAPGANTLETGAGLSTLFFAVKGARHIAIAPDPALFDRIRRWCSDQGVADGGLRLIAEPSEQCLPALQCDPLDAALIDGRHGFPAPFLDWFYIDRRLKVGGLLVVDDTQIWTGMILRDFLRADPAWRMECEVDGKTALFQKLADGSSTREWVDQPWVARRCRRINRSLRWKRAAELLMTGRWPTLWNKLRRR